MKSPQEILKFIEGIPSHLALFETRYCPASLYVC